ncbi:cupin domain-containing protein [Halosolutus gelatinilyticus]|uniref:cupin domain-containing protein n=1 Tax=Halosolutus gelatinilyticus TaxID=2931975 RepID=UPI001FF5B521|nr:cupin domain-containing protein [Halosolutus gelatinilyticus]
MERVSIDEIDPDPYEEAWQSDRRPLTDPLGAEHVALTRYVLAPGERFSGSVHAHADQEEVFVVLEGTAAFETRDGEVTVGPDEAVRFAPGDFQSGRNAGDEPLVALAIGAPRDTDDIRIDRIPVLDDRDVSCPDCGHDDMRMATADDTGLVCPECGTGLDIE